jgi:hypothetical protein
VIEARFQLCLTLQAPLLSHAAGTLSLGVDAAMQRYRGRPVLNGSQIRGNLRHLLQHFANELAADGFGDRLDDDHLRVWFGPPDHTEQEHKKAALAFDFFWLPEEASLLVPDQPLRYRIEIANSGTVAPGSLQVIESPYPVGAEVHFRGEIEARIDHGRFEDDDEALAHCEHWLSKAVAALPAVGALKGVGFGRVLRAELYLGEPSLRAKSKQPAPLGTDRIGIALYLDRPFSLGIEVAHQPENNRYLHGTQIPGAAIKAVMARAWEGAAESLNERFDFDRLVITNALPASRYRPERRLPLPLSLALFDVEGGSVVRDLALRKRPCLLRENKGVLAPRFLPDWKEAELATVERLAFGRKPLEIPRLLSVRTAIELGPNVAEEDRLFALECTDVAEHVWCADIDLSQVPEGDRLRVRDNLIELLDEGLDGIGKTNAKARVEICSEPFSKSVPDPSDEPADEPVVILLRSPARMLPDDLDLAGTNGDEGLAEKYRAYWLEESNGLFEPSHYFAQQEMVGGKYYQLHYRQIKNRYEPAWLTRTGSVFVLCPTDGADPTAVRGKLAEWASSGLRPVGREDGTHWERNPFLRENGLGEVAVNHPIHWELEPPEDEILSLGEGS